VLLDNGLERELPNTEPVDPNPGAENPPMPPLLGNPVGTEVAVVPKGEAAGPVLNKLGVEGAPKDVVEVESPGADAVLVEGPPKREGVEMGDEEGKPPRERLGVPGVEGAPNGCVDGAGEAVGAGVGTEGGLKRWERANEPFIFFRALSNGSEESFRTLRR
jgi:hypothetical protein